VTKTHACIYIVLIALSTSLVGCGFSTNLQDSGASNNSSNITPTPSPAVTTFVASWEKSDSKRRTWSDIVRQIIESKAEDLYKGPTDVASFCPMYDRLGKQDRLNFWAEFISAVSKFESSWKATTRYTETTMGTDPVTGSQVVSEGLLQLSYQDVEWATFCEFDWANDNKLYPALTDARRSILDPYKNLSCGLQILNRQVKKKGAIALSSGVYWSVLRLGGNRLPEIQAMTNALSFCK
jgi:hypothetical protein